MFKNYKAKREIAFTKAMKSKKKPSITRALIGFPRFTEAQTGMYLHGKKLKGKNDRILYDPYRPAASIFFY